MADALKTFREGEDILASDTNDNNQYLLSKLSDNAAQVQQYVKGEVATIQSNVASVQATLQNNIAELDAKKPIYIVESRKTENGGFREWSDGYKEQWGNVSGASVTVVFEKPFEDTNYYISWQFLDNKSDANADFNKITVNNKTTTSAILRMSSGSTFKCNWMACGF